MKIRQRSGGAAALAGYLRDIEWQGENSFDILQGEDMGNHPPGRAIHEEQGRGIMQSGGHISHMTDGSAGLT
jgi:hypothetical protein